MSYTNPLNASLYAGPGFYPLEPSGWNINGYTVTTNTTSVAFPVASSEPLTEVERLLADVEAVCALGR